VSYVTTLSGIDLCTAIFGPCPPPVSVPLATPATLTTYEVCFRPTDSGGRVAISVDPSTYFNDAGFTPAGGSVPVALTQRFCQVDTATGTLFTSDLFTHVGDPPALTHGDILGPAAAAEKRFGYTALTPSTGATIRRLAKLEPRTLAVMHGSSYSGDAAPVLETLAGFYDDLLQKGAAAGRG